MDQDQSPPFRPEPRIIEVQVLDNRDHAPIQITEGRGSGGRFVEGCKPGPGRPSAALRRRQLFDESVTDSDLVEAIECVRRIINHGEDKDALAAAKLLLNRSIGSVVPADVAASLAELERKMDEIEREKGEQ